MSITIKSVTTQVIAGTNSLISVTVPSASVDDLLVIIVSNDYYTEAELGLDSITPSATATEITSFDADGGSLTAHIKAWWAPVTTAGTVTVTCTTSHTDEEKALAVYLLSGADITNPIDGAANSGTVTTSANVTAPSVSPTGSNDLLICHLQTDGASGGNTTTYTPPAGMTQQYSVTDNTFMRAFGASQILTSSGSTGTRTITGDHASGWVVATMAIKAATTTLPAFVADYTSDFTITTSNRNISVTTQAGDLLVVYAGSEDSLDTIGTPSGNGVTFTLQQSVVTANFATAYVWTGIDSTGGTNWSLNLALTGNSGHWGYTCVVFRNSAGFGNSASNTGASGAPSVSLSTSTKSAVVVFSDDWIANDGASRVWRTANGITPTTANGLELDYGYVNGAFTAYGAYYPDTGAAGTTTVGLTAPAGQKYSIVAQEVLAPAGAPAAVFAVAWLTA